MLPRPCAMLVFLLAGAVFVVIPASARAQAQPPAQSFDGLWLTDGYGELIEFQGDELHWFEITQVSCVPAGKATRKSGAGADNEIVFVDEGAVVRVTSGSSPDTRWLHEDGSVSSILLRRTDSKPEVCRRTLADTPVTNYQVFWATFAEHYPFFALRKMDWLAVDKKFRPEVTPATKPEELFRILSEMIEPLHDAHTGIRAKSIQQRFHGYRPAPQPVMVHVSQRPGFRGAVVLLTSADSVSAAETFTMAVLDRQPHVVRVGANTQGVFSDVLGRKLPNGWSFGLPNEIYLTKDGKAFDGPGVPPDIELPIFPAEDLANGRDSTLNKALELLAPRNE